MIDSALSGGASWLPSRSGSLRHHVALGLLAVALAVVVALLPLGASAALVLGSGLALLVLVRPGVGLVALALAVPFGSMVEVRIGEGTVSALEPLVALLVLSWLAAFLSRRERPALVPWPIWPVFLFLGVLAFEVTLAPSVALSFKELLRWIELALVAVVGGSILRENRQIAVLLAVILVAGILEALLGWYQFFFRIGPPAFAWGPFLRAHGTFSQPNPFAGYLAMVWPLALSVTLFWLLALLGRRRAAVPLVRDLIVGQRISPLLGLLALLAVVIIGAAVLMSFSRGAWLGLVVAVAVIAALYRRRAFIIMVVATGCVLVIAVLGQFNLLPAIVATRVHDALAYFRMFDPRTVPLTPQNWALVERMVKWQVAWAMFETAPLFGVGPGHYDAAYLRFAPKEWPQSLGHAHNYYLNVLAEMGAAGLAAYLTTLAGWFAGAILYLRRLRGSPSAGRALDRAALAGVAGAIAAAAVHNGFDNLYVHGMNIHVGLLLGMMLAVGTNGLKPLSAKNNNGGALHKEDR